MLETASFKKAQWPAIFGPASDGGLNPLPVSLSTVSLYNRRRDSMTIWRSGDEHDFVDFTVCRDGRIPTGGGMRQNVFVPRIRCTDKKSQLGNINPESSTYRVSNCVALVTLNAH